MSQKTEAQAPKVELATKDWTLKELMDTERRIEKAFHKQTQFLSQKNDDLKNEINNQTRWMVGLIITMTIAIIVAVLFQG